MHVIRKQNHMQDDTNWKYRYMIKDKVSSVTNRTEKNYLWNCLNKNVLRLRLKDVIDWEWYNETGKEFQIFGTANEKETLPYILVLTEGISHNLESEDDLKTRFGV